MRKRNILRNLWIFWKHRRMILRFADELAKGEEGEFGTTGLSREHADGVVFLTDLNYALNSDPKETKASIEILKKEYYDLFKIK